ncbi:tetratricopeptide repeat protein [Candidatus Sumerlaeota bacterium]|nr:tetratricopeptide repeat protein [Candidatus Sumerlaeota bacterium]
MRNHLIRSLSLLAALGAMAPTASAQETSQRVNADPEVEEYLDTLLENEQRVHNQLFDTEDIFLDLDQEALPTSWRERQVSRTAFLQALHLSQSGRWGEAETILRESVETLPESTTVPLALVETLRSRARIPGASPEFTEEALEILRGLAESHPDKAEVQRALGDLLAESGNLSEAADALRRACELQPLNTQNHLALGMILMQIPDSAGALEALREVRRLQPNNLYALQLLAEAAERAGEIDEAVDCYEEIIRVRPEILSLYIDLGNIHRTAGHTEEALEAYERGLLLDPSNRELTRHVQLALGTEDEEALFDWWEDLIADHPDSIELALVHVSRLLNAGQEDRAIDCLRTLSENLPDDARVALLLGQMMVGVGRGEEAVPHLRRAVALAPDSPEMIDNLIRTLQSLGRLDEAREIAEQTAGVNHRASIFNSLGAAYGREGQWEQAIELEQEAVRLASDSVPLRIDLLNLLAQSGESERGLEATLEAIEQHGLLVEVEGQSMPLYFWLHGFRSAVNDENMERVTDTLTRAAEANGSDAAFRALGQFHYDFDQPELARAALDRAWEVADNDRSRTRIARLHLFNGDQELARERLDEALAETPDSVELRLWKGVLLQSMGEHEAADALWDETMTTPEVVPHILHILGALRSESWSDTGLALALATVRSYGLYFDQPMGDPYNFYLFISMFEEAIPEHFDEVEATLLAAAGEEPDVRTHSLLGQFYATNGHPERARESFLAAWQVNPEDRDMAIGLSELCRDLELYDTAVTILEDALGRNPDDDMLFYFLGGVYDSAGRTAEAERALRQAIALNPENFYALNHLGYMFTEENINLEEALELVERAVELSDLESEQINNGFIVDSLGWAHYRLGNWDEAVHWLEEAIRRAEVDNLRDGLFHEHLGDALIGAGRTEEAVAAWMVACELYEGDDDPESCIAVLEKILAAQPENTEASELLSTIQTSRSEVDEDIVP